MRIRQSPGPKPRHERGGKLAPGDETDHKGTNPSTSCTCSGSTGSAIPMVKNAKNTTAIMGKAGRMPRCAPARSSMLFPVIVRAVQLPYGLWGRFEDYPLGWQNR